jgi:hypothetical protein
MLRRDGYVKVLDFGLAKLTQQEETPTAPGAAERWTFRLAWLWAAQYRSVAGRRGLTSSAQRRIQPGRGTLRDAYWTARHSRAKQPAI